LKLQDCPAELFHGACADETILPATKSFFAWHAELQKRPMVIRRRPVRLASAGKEPGGRQMHAVSVIIALALVIASSTMAGSSPSDLPGIGTFAYSGSPIAASLPHDG
jgi:hypothetical protein